MEIRAVALKIYADIMTGLLREQRVLTNDPAVNQDAVAILKKHIQDSLLPKLPQVLEEQGALPMFALKLLAAVATHTNMMPNDSQLISQLLSFYSQSSPLLNRHTLSLVLHLIPSLPLSQLTPLVPHTSQILHSM